MPTFDVHVTVAGKVFPYRLQAVGPYDAARKAEELTEKETGEVCCDYNVSVKEVKEGGVR